MWESILCNAISSRKRVSLNYDGYFRIVEIHAVGRNKIGNEVVRVWQVRGGSQSGEYQGWKLLRLDEAGSATLLNEHSDAPRIGYKRNDSAIEYIYCQI